ncbi:MAG: aldo/keto reductase, partial [Bacteriovoracaceae bacterium]
INMSNDPKVALKMLDQTLKNFQSDYVDIYMVHWPDSRVDIRSTLETLYTAKIKGKICHLGLCNTNLEDLKKAKEVCPVEAVQMEVNLFRQNNFQELEPELEKDVLTMGWGTYDKGVLAGTVSVERSFESSDCRSWAPWWKKSDWKERVRKKNKLAKKFNLSASDLAALALAYSQRTADTSLCGMKNDRHLRENIKRLQDKADFSDSSKWEEILGEFSLL